NFNVDQNYDISARAQVTGTLVKATSSLYFYIEKGWWDAQTSSRQNEILSNLEVLSNEFSEKIYPTLTATYGSEARPGIDNDNKIAIFFESIAGNLGGYYRSVDE